MITAGPRQELVADVAEGDLDMALAAEGDLAPTEPDSSRCWPMSRCWPWSPRTTAWRRRAVAPSAFSAWPTAAWPSRSAPTRSEAAQPAAAALLDLAAQRDELCRPAR
jgi:hypothetical protein